MTSNDNTLEMSRMELLLREHFARVDKQFADMRADNAEFKTTIINEMNKRFEAVNSRFDGLRSEMNSRFDGLQAQIYVIQNDITGLKHDVANLQHWNYWILAVILAVFVLPNFAAGIKTFLVVVREGISGIITLFRKAK